VVIAFLGFFTEISEIIKLSYTTNQDLHQNNEVVGYIIGLALDVILSVSILLSLVYLFDVSHFRFSQLSFPLNWLN